MKVKINGNEVAVEGLRVRLQLPTVNDRRCFVTLTAPVQNSLSFEGLCAEESDVVVEYEDGTVARQGKGIARSHFVQTATPQDEETLTIELI